jgi:hypothetical protein
VVLLLATPWESHARRSRLRFAYVLIVLLAGCECLPVPTADPSPPGAGIIVEYRPATGGARVTRTLGVGDPDATVDADKNDVVAVVYSGSDEQGVRSAKLEYDMSYSTGTTIVQPLLAEIKVASSCPKKTVLDAHNFESDGHPWRYKFASRAENWLGGTATSGTLTVRTQ